MSCSSWPPLILKIQLDRYAHSATVCAILYFLTLRRFYMRPNVYRWKRRRCHADPWPPLVFKGHALSLRQTYKDCDVASTFLIIDTTRSRTMPQVTPAAVVLASPTSSSLRQQRPTQPHEHDDTDQHDSQRSGTECLSQIVANTDPSTT